MCAMRSRSRARRDMPGIEACDLQDLVTIPRSRPGNRHDCPRSCPRSGGVVDDGLENRLDCEGARRFRWGRPGLVTASWRNPGVPPRRVPGRLPEPSGSDRSIDPKNGSPRRHRLPPANRKRRGTDAGAGLRRVPSPPCRLLAGRHEPEHRAAATRRHHASSCGRATERDASAARCGVAYLLGDTFSAAVLIRGLCAHEPCAASSRLENFIAAK
jgi:hypothetical protein